MYILLLVKRSDDPGLYSNTRIDSVKYIRIQRSRQKICHCQGISHARKCNINVPNAANTTDATTLNIKPCIEDVSDNDRSKEVAV